jgi:cytochrome c553
MIAGQATADIDIEAAQTLYQHQCTICHGVDADLGSTIFPTLAHQHASYLTKSLKDYQQGINGPRPQAIMGPISTALSASDIDNLSAYLSTLPAKDGTVGKQWLALGQKLYRRGDSERHIPACAACHGPAGAGNFEAAYPKLAGQNSAYVIQQLQSFAADKRTSDPRSMMRDIAKRLTNEDQQAVASFINGLRPNA